MKASRLLGMALSLILSLLACAPGARAEANDYYIVADGNTRYLTEAELWDWQYEALGYLYNEFFARHGRAFRPGEKYDEYFRQQAWYQVNPKYHYGLLNHIEQANEKLVHQVLVNMRAEKTTNPAGKPLPRSNEEAELNTVLSFRSYSLQPGQKLDVYTGPGTRYFRGGNGKASVSTNDKLQIAGVENGWIAIEYETSSGKRIGYVPQSKLKDKLRLSALELYYDPGIIVRACNLTDDPDAAGAPLSALPAGMSVMLLGPYTRDTMIRWAYIEAETELGTMRGFVPIDCVSQLDGGESYDWEDELGSEDESEG